MVRKRSRKYDSDENDSDSDDDFSPNGFTQPAQKKYSLRERKRVSSFATDFDYYEVDEEDVVAKESSSDDEDFEVPVDGTCTYFEQESQHSEEQIDYEDIIRADIVVNKQHKIDYDNVIQKTEIKIVPPKKRGRKPKNQTEKMQGQEEVSHLCEPDLDNLAHIVEDQRDQEVKSPETINCTESQLNVLPKTNSMEESNNPIGVNFDLGKEQLATEMVIEKSPEEKIIEEDEDDDVIVLGELKQDVIVLDD